MNKLYYIPEVWKPVTNYDEICAEYYEVSNYGRVRSLDRFVLNKYGTRNRFAKGKVLAQRVKEGYNIAHLSVDGNEINAQVHRLVAKAFIPNPDNLPCVNHKDENKLNNFVYVNPDGTVDFEKSNLEWCTVQYNNTYGTMQERSAKKRLGMKMPKESVDKMAEKHKKRVGMFLNGVLIKEFDSAADAERENPIFKFMSISACCNGRLKTYRGYDWKFL